MVLKDLDEKGLLFDAPKFEHEYPHCWRCDTPLIYYARESWFIKMTAVKDDLIRNNNTVNWIPDSIGKGRFGDWLENIQDWGISRNRYWGTPLPVWECECGHQECIGSRAELAERSGNPEDAKVELHRPYIDAVTFKCPDCGKEMHRVPEVIDCWFDSGSMPFAQHHYPFENKETFEKQFPAQFISEAVDQTRGWFYSLLAISTLLFNKAPYENVIVLGLVQDENGQKMSKSKGNAVDPLTHCRPTVPMRSAGTSTPAALRGCRAVSQARRSWKDRESSWEPCGTPTRSLFCMQTSTTSMQQNTVWSMTSWLLWINGCCPVWNPL